MAERRQEEKQAVDLYTNEYCEWRRCAKKNQKKIEEREVQNYG